MDLIKQFKAQKKSASSFEKKMENISNKAKSIGDKISGIGTKLTVGVTTPLAIVGKGMVDAASDFDENLNKISVAFGDNADEVKAWADTATQSFWVINESGPGSNISIWRYGLLQWEFPKVKRHQCQLRLLDSLETWHHSRTSELIRQ